MSVISSTKYHSTEVDERLFRNGKIPAMAIFRSRVGDVDLFIKIYLDMKFIEEILAYALLAVVGREMPFISIIIKQQRKVLTF